MRDLYFLNLSPDTMRFLQTYRTWPAWRRWLWRKGWTR